jgi:four helix bundle protein
VSQKLLRLHLEVDKLTLQFPRHELYELGSQLRRAANAAPANLAEGWNNKHTNIYLEGINRATGECQEVEHHLDVAFAKGYASKALHASLIERYQECERMLWGLASAVERSKERMRSRTYHLSPDT